MEYSSHMAKALVLHIYCRLQAGVKAGLTFSLNINQLNSSTTHVCQNVCQEFSFYADSFSRLVRFLVC